MQNAKLKIQNEAGRPLLKGLPCFAFCAILVNYPLSQVFSVFKVMKKVMTAGGEDTSEIVTVFVNFAKKARTEGFLSLEGDVKLLKNDFLKRGVQLVIDGSDQEFIR